MSAHDRCGLLEYSRSFVLLLLTCSDPQIEKDFLDALYAEGPFLRSLPIALTTEGVVVIQVGEAPWQDSASEVYSHQKNRARLINSLVSVGFEVTQDYEEVRTTNGETRGVGSLFRTNWFALCCRAIANSMPHGSCLSRLNPAKQRTSGRPMKRRSI